MDENASMNEIINSITDETEKKKKKRGRPPKNKTENKEKVVNKKTDNENEEIVLHFKITKKEIDEHVKNGLSIQDIEKNINSLTDDMSDKNEDKLKINNLKYIIKKSSEKINELTKIIENITPIYETQVKQYSDDITFIKTNNQLIIPEKTNICCYNCTLNFETMPIYNIVDYKNNNFVVFGKNVFCSFNCYLANISSDHEYIKKENIIKKLFLKTNKITNINHVNIKPASDRAYLKKFGGPMTEEEYKLEFKLISNESSFINIPFVFVPCIVEEFTKTEKKINYYLNNNPNTTNTKSNSKKTI